MVIDIQVDVSYDLEKHSFFFLRPMNLYVFFCSIEEPLANYVYRKTFTKWQLETTPTKKQRQTN